MKINYDNRIRWKEDPSTYQHLIKPYCVVCDTPIRAKDYEDNGNFCEVCCHKATQMAYRRAYEKREMAELRGEIPVDNFKQAVRSVLV